MSLLPQIGHLYHDSAISNSSVILDANEYLRTREINAREQRRLETFSKYLERAKTAGERVRDYEKWGVKQNLKSIKIKTPTLEKGLRQETRRIQERLIKHDIIPSNNHLPWSSMFANRRSTGRTLGPQSRRSNNLPSNRAIGSGTFQKSDRHTHPTITSLSLTSFKIVPESRSTMPVSTNDRFYLKAADRHRPPHSNGTNFLKRAEHVVKSLHKLYVQLLERQQGFRDNDLTQLLDSETWDLLNRARMVLGQKTTNEMMALYLDQKNGRIYSADEDKTVCENGEDLAGELKMLKQEEGRDIRESVNDGNCNDDRQSVDFVEESVPKIRRDYFKDFGFVYPQNRTKTSGRDWSNMTTYQAVSKEYTRNNRMKQKRNKPTVVTLTGKQRKTLIYR